MEWWQRTGSERSGRRLRAVDPRGSSGPAFLGPGKPRGSGSDAIAVGAAHGGREVWRHQQGCAARGRGSEEVRRLEGHEAMVVPRRCEARSRGAVARIYFTLVVEWRCCRRSAVCEVGCVQTLVKALVGLTDYDDGNAFGHHSPPWRRCLGVLAHPLLWSTFDTFCQGGEPLSREALCLHTWYS